MFSQLAFFLQSYNMYEKSRTEKLRFFVNDSINFVNNFSFPKNYLYTFLSNFAKLPGNLESMAEILCWRQLFFLPIFQHLNCSNFWTTCPIWMNKSSLESYYVVVFKYYAFDHFSCLFCWGQQFFIDFRKNMSGGINHVQGISASKIRWKMFFRKNLIIKKIYLHQQKMSGNNANFFDIFKELLNSFFTPSLNH